MRRLTPAAKPISLRDSLHQHLHMYALSASAAGVSLLALAQPGEAEIIYTPAQVTLTPGQHYALDLNNDGITDFTLKNHTYVTTSGWWGYIVLRHPAGNEVAAHRVRYGFPWAYAFRSGAHITKQARHFVPGQASMAKWAVGWWGSTKGGSWISAGNGVSNRYLGLKFKIDGQVHYGWARLSMGLSPWTVTLTGYAYETIPNKTIFAGQEQGNDESGGQSGPTALTQPDQAPATLGALAQGAAALSLWRRHESQQSPQSQNSDGEHEERAVLVTRQ